MLQNQKLSLAKTTTATYVSTRNACKLCAPLGASIVFRGIEGCVPLIHGSQGCATYIRRYLISHFREPMDVASTSFDESATIFGGQSNLAAAIKQNASAVLLYQFAVDLENATQRLLRTSLVQTSAAQQ